MTRRQWLWRMAAGAGAATGLYTWRVEPHWVDFAQREQLQVSLDFKRYVFEATRTLANVRVTDLQTDAAITHDLGLYHDIYHFAPTINERLVEATCKGRSRVDATSIDEFERQLRGQVTRINTPTGLAAALGAPDRSTGEGVR